MDGLLSRLFNLIELEPSSAACDDQIYAKWKKSNKMRDWVEEKRSEFEITKIDEGIQALTQQFIEKTELLKKFSYAESKESQKVITSRGSTNISDVTLLRAFSMNPKNKSVDGLSAAENVKKRINQGKDLDDSVITLLKNNVTAAEIWKYSEKYYERGFTLAWALNLLNINFSGLVSSRIKCSVMESIMKLFKRGTSEYWHYSWKTIACGQDIQSLLRGFFFDIIAQTLEYCITTKNDAELLVMLDSLKWKYTATDFMPLKGSQILEKLSPRYDCYITSHWKLCETGMSFDAAKQKLQLMLISTFDFIVMRVILRACKEKDKEKDKQVELEEISLKLERYASKIDENVANSILKELLTVIFNEIQQSIEYNKTKAKDAPASPQMLSFSLLAIVVKICNFIQNATEQQSRIEVFQDSWVIILLDTLQWLDIETQYSAIKCLQFLLKLTPEKVLMASEVYVSQNKEKYESLLAEIENPFVCIMISYMLPKINIRKLSQATSTIEAIIAVNSIFPLIEDLLFPLIMSILRKTPPEKLRESNPLTFDCIIALIGGMFKGLNPRTSGYYTKTGQIAEIADNTSVPGKIYIMLQKEKEEENKQSGAWQSLTKVKATKFIPREDKLNILSLLQAEQGIEILSLLEKIILTEKITALRKARIAKVFSAILDQREDIAQAYLAQSQLKVLLGFASIPPTFKYSKSKTIVEQMILYLPEEKKIEPKEPERKFVYLGIEGEQFVFTDGKETYKFGCEFYIGPKAGPIQVVNYDPDRATENSKNQIAFMKKHIPGFKQQLYSGIFTLDPNAMGEDFQPNVFIAVIQDKNDLFVEIMKKEEELMNLVPQPEVRAQVLNVEEDINDIFALEKKQNKEELITFRKAEFNKCFNESKLKCDGKINEIFEDLVGFACRRAILSVLKNNKDKLKTMPKELLGQLFESLQLLYIEADYLEKGHNTNLFMSPIAEILDALSLHPEINSQFFLFIDKISQAISKDQITSYKLFTISSDKPVKMYFPFIHGFFSKLLHLAGPQLFLYDAFPSIMVLLDSIRNNPGGDITNVYCALGMVVDILKCCEQNINNPRFPEVFSKILSSNIIKYIHERVDRMNDSRIYTQILAINMAANNLFEKALKIFKNSQIEGEYSKFARMAQKILMLTTLPDLSFAYKLFFQKRYRYDQDTRTKDVLNNPLYKTGYSIAIHPKRECTYSVSLRKNNGIHILNLIFYRSFLSIF